MLSGKRIKYGVRLALALITGLAVVGLLPIPAQAQASIDLEIGSIGGTSWNMADIEPGDSGAKTLTLHNAGYRDGSVTIWISDIISDEGTNPESETGDTADPGELADYLLFNLSSSRLTTNISLPATIGNLPQSVSDPNYIKISPLRDDDTITLDWEWQLPLEVNNDIQGDSLSFTVNYMLEELPSGGGGDGGRDDGNPPKPQTLLLQVDMWGKVTSVQMTQEGVVMETIEAVSPDGALVLLFPQGTRVLDSTGKPVNLLEVKSVAPPQPPPGKLIIGPSFDLQPSCTFEPPIKLILHYHLQELGHGIDGEDLVIAHWDQVSQDWVVLPGEVDTLAETITAQLNHSSTFVVLAEAPAVTPIPPRQPSVPPVPDTTPATGSGVGVWLAVVVGIALMLTVIVWVITRQRTRQVMP